MSEFNGVAILEINKDAKFTIPEDNLDKIVWLDGTTPIAKADIEKKCTNCNNVVDEDLNLLTSEYDRLCN